MKRTAEPARGGPARLAVGAAILGPLLALAAIWLPVILHYYVPTPDLSADIVERSRIAASDSTLDVLGGINYETHPMLPSQNPQWLADELLEGRFHYAHGITVPANLEPEPRGLDAGLPTAELAIGSLAGADVLLQAYGTTRDEKYFAAVLRSVLAWARYERRAWLPQGFLWNDHAIANRLLVLTRIWAAYRHRPDYDPATAGELLTFVARSAAELARPANYTYRTNHGLMQNLGLLHVAAAFPLLPGATGYADLATTRLARLLPHYVSSRGIVLEHSTGYQLLGVRLLRHARTYLRLLGRAESAELRDRQQAAACVLQQLTRPDGSIPLWGDTRPPVGGIPPDATASAGVCPPLEAPFLDENFGLVSLRLSGPPAGHLFVSWQNFVSQSHKHLDELAALLWYGGQDWWTTTAYWPYGTPDRNTALGWQGSNAPHEIGEGDRAGRESRLVSAALGEAGGFLELDRRNADGLVFRRQLLALNSGVWLMLDSTTGGPAGAQARGFEVQHTFMPDVVLRPGNLPRSWTLESRRGGVGLDCLVAGSEGFSASALFGSHEPFGGFVAVNGEILPAPALLMRAPAGGWLASLWLGRPAGLAAAGELQSHWTDTEHWALSASRAGGNLLVERSGADIRVQLPAGGMASLRLHPGSNDRAELASATRAFAADAAGHAPFHDYEPYRLRATYLVAALFAGQLLVLWIVRRVTAALPQVALCAAVAWGVLAAWLYYGYLH